MKEYKQSFEVRWADLDPNRHLRHTSYNDYAAHVRFKNLEENGFSAKDFATLNIGPVIFREETYYFKEVVMNERICIDIKVGGLSHNGDRFQLIHNIFKENGSLAAKITVEGAWLDLKKRKLITPPEKLIRLLRNSLKTDDYQEISRLNNNP